MIDRPDIFLRRLFDRAVEVADPMRSLKHFLPEKPKGRSIVIGAGKASARMAETVEASRLMARRLADDDGLRFELRFSFSLFP